MAAPVRLVESQTGAAAVVLSAGLNTKSWIRQPNSGRIGRSPGDVDTITRIASWISAGSS